jgi:hypothetical protein
MRRDIITAADAELAERQLEAGVVRESVPAAPAPDQWFEQLIKYIPAEAVSLYLALDGLVRSIDMGAVERQVWLGAALLLSMILEWLYLKRVWRVSRNSQIAVSTLAMLTYVFALGGVFSTFAFYKPWQGTMALVVTTAFLALFPPPGPPQPPPSAS